MARPLSEAKRIALLEAAVGEIAFDGLGAVTAKIAKAAGVASGTLFVYFPTKDDLFNQLYIHLKQEILKCVMEDYPKGAPVEEQYQHFWNRYIEWGSHTPEKLKVLRQLTASEKLTYASRSAAWQAFSDVHDMLTEGFNTGVLREQPLDFLGGVMDAIASLVLERIEREPRKIEEYTLLGWQAFWGAISLSRVESIE
ncbi:MULTISPECIES: TetR/AcrR family transcriptional regulator [Raoultella]|uniref:TetR/AcrR family transcriptional regulator n=1 Tax=Raoultella TaxID=160674 RepID=UPI0021685D48|nr:MULTISPECIES: TetR/AcrR family transcriptional regulator [Raoultella]MCS4273669.1 AcrR family transcriptional regulator [Raoultella sp. BIGb0132]MCS4290298.1 AcrR family transcriptional regulator [Raoultella terrigena]